LGSGAGSADDAARSIAKDAALVALVKLASAGVALAWGFRAVSDDDFARVVIAEEWARSPKLDPTGTSWLPLPFWIVGLVMRVFGRGLDVARAVSIALGVASALVVYVAALWITQDRRASLVGSIIAAVFPWSARLGVATVPELPAAALALLAAASLSPPLGAASRSEGRALVGGLALFASALCRYEAWPIAGIFAAITSYRALRPGALLSARMKLFLAALLALAAPAAWIAWNQIAHGDALHFLDRVAAYRRALGGGGDGSALKAIFLYPMAFARQEPELFGSFLIVLGFAWRLAPSSPSLTPRARRYVLPSAILLAQLAALAAAMMKDGAPTHHPERALLSVMLLFAIALGDLGLWLYTRSSPRSRRAVALWLAVFILPMALGLRRAIRMEDYAERGDEVAVGLAAGAALPPGEKALIEVVDYGYFAVIAAFARPEDAVIDRSIDPRGGPAPSSFVDHAALLRRLEQSGARYFIARLASPAVVAPPEQARGSWGLFRASSAGPRPGEGAPPTLPTEPSR